MKNYKDSRGWRNNNPLNIKHGCEWLGMCDKQKDMTFVQFLNMPLGYRAAVKIMLSYWRHFAELHKVEFTIDRLVRRWCPSPGVDSYIRLVEHLTGIRASLALPDPRLATSVHIYCPIIGAMTVQECGCPWSEIPWHDIEGGYWLAFHVKKVKEYKR